MQSALILYCQVPNIIKKIRSEYDDHNLPAHITLTYLINNDYKKILAILEKQKKFKVILDKVIIDDNIIALKMSDTSKINNLIEKINNFDNKLPKSGFHLSLAYKRKYKLDNVIKDEIISKIKLPIEVNIEKIWLMKRNKSLGQDWYRSKTIFLL